MAKFMTAPAGTNPMEMPEIIKKQRMGKLQMVLTIGGGLLFLLALCGLPAFFLTRPKTPAAASAITATSSPTVTLTPTATSTGTLHPISTNTPTATHTGTLAPTSTPAATQTPWIVTQVVVQTKVVNNNVPYPVVTVVVATVHVPVQQTVIVTTTPEPTQTPWIIQETIEVTRIVEVTPTETPTPEATQPPTETPATPYP